MSNFLPRYINVSIGLGLGILGDLPPPEQTVLSGHRVSVNIQAYGGETFGKATVKIYGMTPQLMNQFTAIGPSMSQIKFKNNISISVGTDPKAMSLIFSGLIAEAFADYNNAPEVYFGITAIAELQLALMPSTDTVVKDNSLISNIVQDIIKNKAEWSFLNYDVPPSAISAEQTLTGSYITQVNSIIDTAIPRIDRAIDYTTSPPTFKIKQWLSAFNAATPKQHVITPKKNMIGYPVYSQSDMTVKSIFIPDIKMGEIVTVDGSIIPGANGQWLVHSIQHDLESKVINGKWETILGVNAYGSN